MRNGHTVFAEGELVRFEVEGVDFLSAKVTRIQTEIVGRKTTPNA